MPALLPSVDSAQLDASPVAVLSTADGCVAVGPGAVWVVTDAASGRLGPVGRRGMRRRLRRVREALQGSPYAHTPVVGFVSLCQRGLRPHLLPDGTVAAGVDLALLTLATGDAHDELDVLAISARLDRLLG